MKINKISKKLIKPHTPTPENLKNYKISFLDQIVGHLSNICVVLFYESKPEKSSLALEESLAEILVQFYPLAGRYMKNDELIECSDEGVEFVEAHVEDDDVVLTDFVAKTSEAEQLKDLLPAADQLLSIQVTYFPCGGVAIAINVSHLVFDAASLGTFIAAWSNATVNPDGDKAYKSKITPSFFDLPSLLPMIPSSKRDPSKSKQPSIDHDHDPAPVVHTVTKRFLLNKEAIERLRSKLSGKSNNISAVRFVCAVIAKALIGVDLAKHGRSRDFAITQSINMRERTIPVPLPKHACGNFALPSLTRCLAADGEEEIGIQQLVDAFGDDIRKNIRDYAEILPPNQGDGRDVIKNSFRNLFKLSSNSDAYAHFTDITRFGFYDADFGWGKPVWGGVGQWKRMALNTTALMSNKEGDGIEAWLYSSQDDMRCFEQDEDIRSLTTTLPSY